MAYPDGVSLAVVTAGNAFTASGGDAQVKVTMTPKFPRVGGGFLSRIVHAPTGWVMTSDSQSFNAPPGSSLSFTVPHVDQAGFRDPAQNAYVGWYYEVQVSIGGKSTTGYTQNVQPLLGQTLVDLDLVPDGPVGEAASASLPAVLSVNGETGNVIVSGDGATDSALAANLAEAKAYTDAEKYIRAKSLPADQDWDLLTASGVYMMNMNPTNWITQHMPGAGRWSLTVSEILPGAKVQEARPWYAIAGYQAIYQRGYSSAGWAPWEQVASTASVTNAGKVPALESRIGAVEKRADAPGSGLKAVGMPLCAGHSGSDAPLSGAYRIPMDWLSSTVPVTRMKVRLRNINIRNGATRAGTVTLDGIWLGQPDANGHFGSVPVQVAGPTTFDGAVGYESPWVVVPGGTLTDKAVSYSYSATSAPWAQLMTGWYDADRVGGAIGNTGFATAYTCAFTVDVVLETYATTPVIATIGDSNSVGIGARALSDAWGTKLANKVGAVPQIFGSSGDTLVGSRDTAAFKWNRFPGRDKADAILWALGQNDVAANYTSSQIIGDLDALVPKAKDLLGRAVYVVSMMPRTSDPHTGFEPLRRVVNASAANQSRGDRGYVDIVPAMSSDDDTIMAAYDSDGTHLNAAGTEAVASHIRANYPVTTPPVAYQTLP